MFQRLSKNWRLFLLALQFLSRIPVRLKTAPTEPELAQSERYFPLVGLVLGGILAALNFSLQPFFPLIGINVILVAVMTLFSGGLHLDGFADSVDAFYSGKNKEKMLAIMKDSHLGVMGGVGLILLFALQLTLLQVIPQTVRNYALLLLPVVSRAMLVNVAFFASYPREQGAGKVYIEGLKAFDWFIAMLTTAALCVGFLGVKGLVVFLLSGAFSISILSYSTRRIDGVTGDVLGLTNELISLLFLIMMRFLYLKG